MRKWSAGIKIASVFIAVILGAGFASGQELLQYFVNYGPSGIGGLVVSGMLFALTCCALLEICRTERIYTYGGLMRHLLGDRIGLVTEVLVAVFLCVLFATMLSAAGATLKQGVNMPFSVGVLLMGLLCFFALMFDLNGLVRINTIVSPFVVIGGVFLGLYAYFSQTATVFMSYTLMPGWILSAVVYASYNLVTGVPVLAAASKLVKVRRDSIIGSALGGLAMTLLGLCMALPLYLHYKNVASVEIPFLMIAVGFGKFFSGLYLAVMLCAVLTTAVSNGFAILQWLSANFNANKKMAAAVLCLLGMAAAHVGFSNFVGRVYPVFALLGIFEIVVILLTWVKLLASRRVHENGRD